MSLINKIKSFFAKKEDKWYVSKEEKAASEVVLSEAPPADLAHYSFSFDPSTRFKAQEEMIPEVASLVHRLKLGESTTLKDIATYFKYFENGYELNSPFFRIKKEFSENCLFSIENTKVFFEDENTIKVFHLVLKEEVTGLRITIEAPTSFFPEFTEQVAPPVL